MDHVVGQAAGHQLAEVMEEKVMRQHKEQGAVYRLCVSNFDCPVSLKVGYMYLQLAEDSLEPGDVRIVDESGEDYIYPSTRFSPTHYYFPSCYFQTRVQSAKENESPRSEGKGA